MYRTSRQNAGKYNAMTAKRTASKGITIISVNKQLKVSEKNTENQKYTKKRLYYTSVT